MMMKRTYLEQTGGPTKRRSGTEPACLTVLQVTRTTTTCRTDYSTGTRDSEILSSQSAPVGDAMHSTDVSERPADQEFETGVQDEQAEEEVQHPSDWFQKPMRLPSPDHAWNTSVPAVHESVQPWLSNLAQQGPSKSRTCKRLTEWHIFGEEATNATTETIRLCLQRRVEDLQLGVESYQKKLNLTKPDTYRSNLRRQDAYTPYSDPRGFIYENKDKKNRLMRIDELHKFSDGTLDESSDLFLMIASRIRMDYKAVRLRFSDPMIQPEPEGSTQGYPLVSVEVLNSRRAFHHNEDGNPVEPTSTNTWSSMRRSIMRTLLSTMNLILCVERFNTTDWNPVKKILLKIESI
ncbi:hypothetical protein Tco_0464978 [Tanacetum coccineum]